jgi:hypothetical protein
MLPKHTIEKIKNKNLSNLSDLYNCLDADVTMQKEALESYKILLSPWELLCMTMFKTLTTRSLFCGNADAKQLFSPISDRENFYD